MLVISELCYYDHFGVASVIEDMLEDSTNEPDVSPSINRMWEALKWDKCTEFVRLVTYEHTVGPLRKAGYVIAPSVLLNWTIREKAIRCAESLVSGVAAGVLVDVNLPPNRDEMSPFYMAVSECLPEFVDLFVRHGAQLNVPCNALSTDYHMLLPMEVAFRSLWGKIWWTLPQSVYELIFSICCSAELEKALITISHILRALPVQLTQKAICRYTREGWINELIIVLYVDAISDLRILKGLKDEYSTLREFVAAKISSAPEEESSFVLKKVLLLFEIFQHTNFSMLGFGSPRAALEKRIKNAGFHLSNLQNQDDVNDATEVDATEVVKGIKPMVDLQQGFLGTSSSILTTALKPSIMEIGQVRKMFTRKLYTPTSIRSPMMKASHEGSQMLSCSLRRTWPVLASAVRRIARS